MKLISCILLFAAFSMSLAVAQEEGVVVPLDFSQVGKGSFLLREKNDRVYSAVIKSYEGFEKFKAVYPIEFDLSKEDFKGSFFIVGFSDNYAGIAADGFKRITHPFYYYLDVADLGLRIDASPPPEGKKHTAYAIIKVSDKVADREKISHVQIREGVVNGLTQWY